MMKRFVLILTTILPLTVSAQKVWTLQQCVEHAQAKNISLKRAEIDIKKQKHQEEASRMAWLPRVHAEVSGTLNFNMNMDLLMRQNFLYAPFTATAEMPIDITGQIRNQANADAMELKALLADHEKTENDLGIAVCSAYLQAVYAKCLMGIAQEEVKLAKERVEMVKSLVDEGARSEGEMTEARSSLAEAEHAYLISSNNWMKERMALAQMLLIDDYENFDVAEVDDYVTSADTAGNINGYLDLQAVVDYAHANNAAVRSAELRIEASEFDIKVAKSELYPRLTLRGQIGAFAYTALKKENTLGEYSNIWKNRNEQLSLNLSIPIFNAFATRTRVKQARLKSENYRLAAIEEWESLKHEIQQAYLSAQTSRQEYASAQNKVNQYREAYAYQRNRYENGMGTWLELREADSNLQKSMYVAQQLHFQCIMNQKILEFYKGEAIR